MSSTLLASSIGAPASFAQETSQQTIPGSADAGRIEAVPEDILPPRERPQIVIPRGSTPETPVPEGASDLTFTLEGVNIVGMTAFTEEDMADIYAPFMDEEIPLSRIWEFAGRITERYQQAGYFLSRAYVPAQEVDGTVTIHVIEGYVGAVDIESDAPPHRLVAELTHRITSQKPARLADLERALLLLNDIHGLSFEAVLGRMEEGAPEEAVRLILKESETPGRGSILFNNHGSRFTGPYRTAFAYETSFIHGQSTAFSGIASIPGGNELWSLNATHAVQLYPELELGLSLGRTVSEPGFTLTPNDIESQSMNWGISLDWQLIRQRQSNLSLGITLDGRNVNTDILDTPLTRDRIRTLRVKSTYSTSDRFNGYNALNTSISRGLDGLGASEPGEPTLSRADAKPDFTILKATWQRSQFLTADWLLATTLTGQRASKALYSSEEFGYGGPSLGRGYDSSEITGDHGIGGAIEAQYRALDPIQDLKLTPIAFYELGKIWNIDGGQADGLSIANAGIGLNLSHPSGLIGSLTIAQPLSKSIDTPIYGNNGHNPRIYFQLGWQF